jgi:hypothetical protein
MKPFLLSVLFLFSASISAEEVCRTNRTLLRFEEAESLEKAQSAVIWAISAHNHLIDQAFKDKYSLKCRTTMKAASLEADSMKYQGGKFVHMHAMKVKGQTVEDAKKRMWEYVDEEYKKVREHEKAHAKKRIKVDSKNSLRACYYRGMALHALMDSTSPSHSGFQTWSLYDPHNAHTHGNMKETAQKKVKKIKDTDKNLPMFQRILLDKLVNLLPESPESEKALKENIELMNKTVLFMQQADTYYLNPSVGSRPKIPVGLTDGTSDHGHGNDHAHEHDEDLSNHEPKKSKSFDFFNPFEQK